MSELLSPIVGGIFTLLGIWLNNHLQNRPKPVITTPDNISLPSPQLGSSPIRIGSVIRDVGIIWILTGLAGLMLGIAMGGSDTEQVMVAAGLGNILFGTVGFVISGSRADSNRWKHLVAVAVGVWLTSFINIFLIGISIGQWFISIFLLLFMMVVGGLVSYIFNR